MRLRQELRSDAWGGAYAKPLTRREGLSGYSAGLTGHGRGVGFGCSFKSVPPGPYSRTRGGSRQYSK